MSQNGQVAIVLTARLAGGVAFDWHTHPVHQLAWAHSGVLTVAIGDDTWVLPPSRALWIPAGVRHALGSSGVATTRSLYFRGPVGWAAPTVVAVSPLLGHLIVHLAEAELTEPARRRAEAVVLDLLEPLHATTIAVPDPSDDRARRVAERLRTNPSDPRALTAAQATTPYRCPGCDHPIAPGTPHLVAWPADPHASVADRRHWHRGCWAARDRRRPW